MTLWVQLPPDQFTARLYIILVANSLIVPSCKHLYGMSVRIGIN